MQWDFDRFIIQYLFDQGDVEISNPDDHFWFLSVASVSKSTCSTSSDGRVWRDERGAKVQFWND
jgi:hypothetical protein